MKKHTTQTKPRNWANTIGKCSCGHSQVEHGEMTRYPDRDNQRRIHGHGGCCVTTCLCPQFTWIGWM